MRALHVALQRALLVALIAAGACYAYRPTGLAPEPGSQVRVVFTTAMTVTTHPLDGAVPELEYPGVLEADGFVAAAASDTLALRLGHLRTAAGPLPQGSGQVAMLPTARIARVEQRRFQAGATMFTGIGLLALATTAFLVVTIAAITRSF